MIKPARKPGLLLLCISVFGLLYLIEPIGTPQLTIALIVIVIVSYLDVVVSLGFIAMSLPLYHQPLETQHGSFAPSELILATAVIGIAAKLVLQTLGAPRQRFRNNISTLQSIFRAPLTFTLVALTFVGIVLLVVPAGTIARAAGLREWRWTLFEPLLFITLLVGFARTSRDRWFVVSAYLTGAFIVALYALGDLLTGSGLSVESVQRISGIFPHPNAFALYELRALVFGGALLVLSPRWRSWLLVPLLVVATAVVASFSRSAILAGAIGALVLALRVERRLRTIILVTTLVGGVLLTIFASGRMISADSANSLSLRVDIWKSGMAMIRDRPVRGYGPDQFLYAYAPRYVEPVAWGERFTSHAHNLLIDFWIRLGIIGAVFAIGAAFLCVEGFIQAGRDRLGSDPVVQAAAIALGAAVIQGMVDNGYFVHDLAMSAWLLAWLRFTDPASMSEPVEG